MASAPRSGRPRLLTRVVRRLIGRRPPRRVDGASATPVLGAHLATELPVRSPWTVLRWWQGVRARRAAIPARPAAHGAATDRPAVRGASGNTPARLPVTRGIAVRRSPLRTTGVRRAALSRPPAPGPDVRPGHELTMRPTPVVVAHTSIEGPDARVGYHFSGDGGGAVSGGPAGLDRPGRSEAGDRMHPAPVARLVRAGARVRGAGMPGAGMPGAGVLRAGNGPAGSAAGPGCSPESCAA